MDSKDKDIHAKFLRICKSKRQTYSTVPGYYCTCTAALDHPKPQAAKQSNIEDYQLTVTLSPTLISPLQFDRDCMLSTGSSGFVPSKENLQVRIRNYSVVRNITWKFRWIFTILTRATSNLALILISLATTLSTLLKLQRKLVALTICNILITYTCFQYFFGIE